MTLTCYKLEFCRNFAGFRRFGSRTGNGSHFVTRDPSVPSFSWPVTRMTRAPWPSPRPRHESITTNGTYKSWRVHDYCLLFFATMHILEF